MNNKKFRLAVTGLNGQVVSAIIERAPKDFEIIALGRPQLELARRDAVLSTLRHAGCDVIINAAAYTQVDKAEKEADLAMRVNADGARNVAEAAAALGTPLLHLSTDYVFSGLKKSPYVEEDVTGPTNVYGRSKLAGEANIKKTFSNYVILRTAWVYSPFGVNFVKTMLRLGTDREEVRVVADQIGNPTNALDIADALITISKKLKFSDHSDLRGVFHLTGRGEASWADVAEAVFQIAQSQGHKPVRVCPITTQDYPTLASRPANSRLDNAKLERIYGIRLPDWRISLTACVKRLLKDQV